MSAVTTISCWVWVLDLQLPVWSCEGSLASLNLNFPLCKMGLMGLSETVPVKCLAGCPAHRKHSANVILLACGTTGENFHRQRWERGSSIAPYMVQVGLSQWSFLSLQMRPKFSTNSALSWRLSCLAGYNKGRVNNTLMGSVAPLIFL